MRKSKKQLKEELSKLKEENNRVNQERLSLLKNREINYNLYNMVKAILMQLEKKEIEVDMSKIKEAENYELYVEDSYLKFAKRIKLIDNRKILKEGD